MPKESTDPKKHYPCYRPCVAALLVDAMDRLLVAERKEFDNSWQFPQGGRDRGETPEQTLFRELREELSLEPEHYRILEQRPGYKYDFPSKKRRFGKFIGQEQIYFRCRFLADDSVINLQTEIPEFKNWRWIYPHEFQLSWLPDFKREVYRKVLADFFQVYL